LIFSFLDKKTEKTDKMMKHPWFRIV